ncbi:hypothetical protein [Flaviaesturariibacter terrae]
MKYPYKLFLFGISILQGGRGLFAQARPFDTLFIERHLTADFYHALFQDNRPHSPYYSLLTDFGRVDVEGRGHLMPNAKTVLPASQWLRIYAFRGSYFLYAPSDWGNHTRISFLEGRMSFEDAEGIVQYVTTTPVRPARQTFQVQLKNANLGSVLRIKLLPNNSDIAVFEFLSADHPHLVFLMVRKEAAARYPIIVNYCPTQKVSEFAFPSGSVQ